MLLPNHHQRMGFLLGAVHETKVSSIRIQYINDVVKPLGCGAEKSYKLDGYGLARSEHVFGAATATLQPSSRPSDKPGTVWAHELLGLTQ